MIATTPRLEPSLASTPSIPDPARGARKHAGLAAAKSAQSGLFSAASNDNTRHPLARFALFAQTPDAMLEILARDMTRQHFDSGERVWATGAPASHINLIVSGIVEIERTRRSGDGVVLGLFGAGECVGLPAMLTGAHYPADALALSGSVELLQIRASSVLQLMRQYLPLALAVNHALLKHNAALQASLEIVGAGTVPKRLAALFLFLGKRFGRTDRLGMLHLNLALSREQIGRLVGARVETVIRVISRWQKADWLTTSRDGIQISRVDMLQRISDAG
ncbi:MAG: Crp/Fnr family transcriptional regulator [Burkholderiaceae bacterium]